VDIRVIGDNGRNCAGMSTASSPVSKTATAPAAITLLPNVNPAFSWVRLAQRIPVRIAFDDVPAKISA
jgi:multidrug resistance efflux pump